MTAILIVDDDPAQRIVLTENCRRLGYSPLAVASGSEGLAHIASGAPVSAMLLDLVMPDIDGHAVLSALHDRGSAVPVIAMVSAASEDSAGSALSLGAVDYVAKPASMMRLRAALTSALRASAAAQALNEARLAQQQTVRFSDFAATGDSMHKAVAGARKAARSTLPLLIEGEAGTGKTRLARAVHSASDRASKPFVVLDCAALPRGDLYAALFGALGSITQAQGGTLLLKEIGELPEDCQLALAHLLGTGELPRDIAGKAYRANIRLIATSTRRVVNLARSGAVCGPLFNRLNVMTLYVPPLRERIGDIALLARDALARVSAETGRPGLYLSLSALARLESLTWAGNVRELLLRVDRAGTLSPSIEIAATAFPDPNEDRETELHHIDTTPLALRREAAQHAIQDRFVATDGSMETLADVERALIAFALDRHGGRMARVARALGIGRSTLYRKLKEYGLESAAENVAA